MKAAAQTTWNKGRVVGKKPPLTPDQVSLIRMILRQEKGPVRTKGVKSGHIFGLCVLS
ncbi:hypothetical protein ACSSV8_003677 [Roseovarius sp. MBR-79]